MPETYLVKEKMLHRQLRSNGCISEYLKWGEWVLYSCPCLECISAEYRTHHAQARARYIQQQSVRMHIS